MGMKVAAVSVLCQDRRVYDVMEMAGTPCPFLGKIGDQATDEWKANPRQNTTCRRNGDKERMFKIVMRKLVLLLVYLDSSSSPLTLTHR